MEVAAANATDDPREGSARQKERKTVNQTKKSVRDAIAGGAERRGRWMKKWEGHTGASRGGKFVVDVVEELW